MINHMTQNENTQNQFSYAIRQLQIGKLLRKANITKFCGVSAYEVFQGKNLFRFLNLKRKDMAVSKNTYYRFLNDVSFNWMREKYKKKFYYCCFIRMTASANEWKKYIERAKEMK